ncbi:PREDICTED: pheromone-binding protein-related protein 6-like [Nicrophorus vespilloides]|uniref:Pheromone-binding protein-related protein 6-like n=1 Tax=Nicrophorus vespilloides TaxID=110193 RepID=A0ABM1N449_NICVS|nr:PREDICTED: pheromone-binding protein-related protein 6-like [Nicrophorus vespilloides]
MAEELRKVCMVESGVSLENLDLVMKGQFPDDRALKCYFKCQFETYHLFTEDDTVDSSTVLSFFPSDLQDRYKHIFENCFDIKGADRCETAFMTHLCYHNADPELYFIM